MCIPVMTNTGYKAAINPIPINPATPSNENNAPTTYWPINAPAGPNTHNAIGNMTATVNAGENTERIAPGITRSKKRATYDIIQFVKIIGTIELA